MSAAPLDDDARHDAAARDDALRGAAVDHWRDAILRELAGATHFRVATVLRETGSTQDAAAAEPAGTVVTAGRQCAGRGRLGSRWHDGGDDGLAATFVVGVQSPDRLAMAAAVAAAAALRSLCDRDTAARIGVKWPNDIVVAQEGGVPRKLAGILIETRGERALIGVGVNVAHERFHREIEHRAVSLRQLGQAADRLAVLLRLLRSLDESLSASDAALEAAYRAVDRTAGLRMRFATPGGEVEGVVLRCDPSIGLQVRAADGVHALPAATTRVLP